VNDLRSCIKQVTAERFEEHYLRRATELKRKRPASPKIFSDSSDSSESESEDERSKIKLPRMRADMEEDKIKMARMERAIKASDLRSR